MTSEEALKERERIKAIIDRKFQELINYRNEHIKKKPLTSIFNKLEKDIIFIIDNPDYVKLQDRVPQNPLSHASES